MRRQESRSEIEAALLYRLNGDYNPLHATPEPGKKMGFGGAIMHGLFSWNSTAHVLVKELGGSDPSNIKSSKPGLQVRSSRVTSWWYRCGGLGRQRTVWEEVRFVTTVEGGKICLSNDEH